MKEPIWQPSESRVKQANLNRFIDLVNQKYGLNITNYDDLYAWSVRDIPTFWQSVWEFSSIIASVPARETVSNVDQMLQARWFEGARLNFAENLLRFRDDRVALVFKGEGLPTRRLTYSELYTQVSRLASALRRAGVSSGDRIAGFMPNMIETVVAMLASASIGAVWTSCSPDFGIKGVLDRFGQIQPKVLFTADGYFYGGKRHDSLARISSILEELPCVQKVVVVPYTVPSPDLNSIPGASLYQDFAAAGENGEILFEQLPFDHPLYIMYSSGTTGVPKCIVHGAGGTLLQHQKEHLLHVDLKREDVVFYFTTCGWMMWNWLVDTLAAGVTVVLYDGSPFFPAPGVLWQLAQDEGITVFGTSAKYLAAVEKSGIRPGEVYDLSKLKTILSTGSPLAVESYDYVYRHVKEDVCLASITGGTDLISCFALANPLGPVYTGELQCRGLGMKVECFDPQGNPLLNQKGELVCTAPFPSMPIYFWNDPDQSKYKKAYFDFFPNVWRHGDYIEITSTGGVIVYGRSDATLNPGGVRIGTAEIYRQVESLPEVADSLVVGQDWDNDVRVILFVKLAEGVALSEDLKKKINTTIRENTTARHVPANIIAISDIPYTLNGKKVEMAVRSVIHNEPVQNQDALANPESLDLFKDLPELKN